MLLINEIIQSDSDTSFVYYHYHKLDYLTIKISIIQTTYMTDILAFIYTYYHWGLR